MHLKNTYFWTSPLFLMFQQAFLRNYPSKFYTIFCFLGSPRNLTTVDKAVWHLHTPPGRTGYQSRTETDYSIVVCISSSGKKTEQCLQNDHFLPKPFKFIDRSSPTTLHWRLHNLSSHITKRMAKNYFTNSQVLIQLPWQFTSLKF